MRIKRKRLFFAIELPETVRQSIATLNDDRFGQFRWTAENNLHLTLRFLGDTDAETEKKLIAAIKKVQIAPFTLPISGVDKLPQHGQAKVVYAGVGAAHPGLFQLRQKMDDTLIRLGIECDMREFRPHITLARCHEADQSDVQRFLNLTSEYDGPIFSVSEFALLESRLSSQGPTYHQVEIFSLDRD